ncbi:MAG TPA: hypothetical protein VFZ04_00990, partial [Longimicrobiales bacterium]
MITARSERNDAFRSAFAVLRAEFRHHTTSDVRAVARDSLAARVFRGLATVCGFSAPDIFVRYSGLRLPDPAKDSALQLGPERVFTIATVRPDSSACTPTPGDQILAVRASAHPRVGESWMIFESGSYHVSTNALRYRQAAGTRQPVTTDVFDDSRSALAVVADTNLRAIDATLHDRYRPGAQRVRHYLTNSR